VGELLAVLSRDTALPAQTDCPGALLGCPQRFVELDGATLDPEVEEDGDHQAVELDALALVSDVAEDDCHQAEGDEEAHELPEDVAE